MPDIKTRKKDAETIKKYDRKNMLRGNIKNQIINTKERTTRLLENNENNNEQYAQNTIEQNIKNTTRYGIKKSNQIGKKSAKKSAISIKQAKQQFKNAREIINKMKQAEKIEGTIKETNRTIKTAKNTNKVAIKTINKSTNASINATRKTAKKSKKIAEKIAKGTKSIIKKTINVSKAMVMAIKGMITFLLAGGWVAVVVVIIICMLGMAFNFIKGIFFPDAINVDTHLMSNIVNEVNVDFMNKIKEIQKAEEYEECKMHSNRAKWKDIFSIYAVEVLNQPQGENIDSLYDMMKSKVKEIFWKMHTITFRVEETEKDIEYINDDGTKRIEKKMVKVLYIDVSSKTLEEMMNEYNFIEEQKSQVAELQKDEFNEVWKEVLSNSLLGSQSIVDVAKTQIGNVGGEPYWSWYGFEARVEWCACFVSWCANECGYIDSGAIPKFAECQEHGVEWFQGCGLWQDRTSGYEPKAGDIIFFDWMDKHDGSSDHVGIVEKCENETVYTIEGNTKGDCCKQNEYNINSEVIMGYGTPLY